MSSATAASSKAMRLFHGLAVDGAQKTEEDKVGVSSSDESEEPNLRSSAVTSDYPEPVLQAYRYNGFIHSQAQTIYLVNGVDLNQLASINLVSVLSGGRTLELKTDKNQVFMLSIGDTTHIELSHQKKQVIKPSKPTTVTTKKRSTERSQNQISNSDNNFDDNS